MRAKSCSLALVVAGAIGATTFSQVELQPNNLAAGGHFGRSVAAGGNILAAGTFLVTAPGTVYVYQRGGDNWTQQAELHSPNPAANDEFGLSLATDGTTLVVGGRGASYILANGGGTWTVQTQLTITGSSVALSRDTAVVSAGAQIFVFRHSNSGSGGSWLLEATITPPQSIGAVALDGDTLIAGAPFAPGPQGSEVGSAYVFVRNGTAWTQQATLQASDPVAFAMFGNGVGVSGDTAAIGAPGDGADVLSERGGTAYVFVRNNNVWTLQTELSGAPDADGDNFGTSLAMIGNTLLIGAYDDPTTQDVGSAFVFTRGGSTWALTAELVPAGGAPGQRFANAVTMADPNTFVLGSPNVSNSAVNLGAVYAFTQH